MTNNIGRPEKNIPSIGNRFGNLTVVGYDNSIKHGIICKCDCGTTRIFNKYKLLYGKAKTCGCRMSSFKNSIHIGDGVFNPRVNKFDARFHRIYRNIIKRCGKKGPWEDVTNKRNSFKEFYKDMYNSYIKHIEQYGEKQTTIDRIDPYGDYCKENCRWATYSEQMLNKRDSNRFLIGGKNYSMSELKRITGITASKIDARYRKYQNGEYNEQMMLHKGQIQLNQYSKIIF